MKMKDEIIKIVYDCGPINSIELTSKISVWVWENTRNHSDDEWRFSDVLDELIKNGDIIEVCYTLPQMDYRIKSLYFPKGTIILKNSENK
jgi:hypothetical protein